MHTVNAYHDGPELGVADFEGRPHVYERTAEQTGGKPEVYLLSPIKPDMLDAVLEDWRLYLRWDAAQDDQSRSGIGSGPRVLKSDLARYLELKPAVDAALKVNETQAVLARGTFLNRMTEVRWARA